MKKTGKLQLLMASLLILFATSASAQYVSNVSKVGTTAATFLEIEVGARALGMGGAFVALANDASAVYWNPAGLARQDQGESMFMHVDWPAEISFDNVSGFIKMPNNMAFGAFVSAVSMNEMEVRTIQQPDGTGELFEAGDLAFGLSFSSMLTSKLSIGANFKYIHQKIWHMSASGVGVDLGLLFETPFKGMKLGMSVSNFGPKMQMNGRDTKVFYDPDPNNPGNNELIPAHLDTENWALPLIFRVGVAQQIFQTADFKLIFALDAVHPNDNNEYVNLGGELNWRDWFFLRSGWKTLFLDDTEQGYTAGVGIRYRLNGNFALVSDVAYQDFGRLDNVIRYTLGVKY